MSPWSALYGLRIGCVEYLNAQPLIRGYDGPVVFDHPSALARGIAAGELDAGLVPIVEAFRAEDYRIVDSVAIACDGPVFSVVLAYRGKLRDVASILLDPASATSNQLLKVLLAEFHGLRPRYLERGESSAALLIGNHAIQLRQRKERGRMLDLGEEWKRCTGLPFVFAVWMLRSDLPHLGEVAAAFRALKDYGLAKIPQIAESECEWLGDRAFRERYLTEQIRFDLGEREKAGIAKFRELLAKHGLAGPPAAPLTFV